MKKLVLLAFVLVLLSTTTGVVLIKPVAAAGTIYIKADGSVDPPSAPISSVDNVLYTFTGNISDSIVVERDNIVVDGAGYTLQGLSINVGIDLTGRSNVTIKNLQISSFLYGIRLEYSSNIKISGNKIRSNLNAGIVLASYSNYSSISGNHIVGISDAGIVLTSHSNYNSISGNNITSTNFGIRLYDSSSNTVSQNNVTNNGQNSVTLSYSLSNTISGNKIQSGLYAAIWFGGSSYNSVSDNSITSSFGGGIWFEDYSDHNIIFDNRITSTTYGITFHYSSSNTISENNVTNGGDGIELYDSSDNTISGNSITNNAKDGIWLEYSSSNTISENDITNNGHGISSGKNPGIWIGYSSNNTISGNNVTENDYGLWLYQSSNTKISGNKISENNNNGVWIQFSSNNELGNNDASNNKYNFGIYSASLSHCVQNIDDSNTVNGKPVYYWVNKQDMTVPLDAGYVALINCTNITVQNLELDNNWQGALLACTTNSAITKNDVTNTAWGIELDYSSNNNTLSENDIKNNDDGVWLYESSSNNTIYGNEITNNDYGIKLEYSSNTNTVSGNSITENDYGLWLYESSSNSIFANNIMNNNQGIWLNYSSSNIIYHNNFVDNTDQVNSLDSTNVWNGSYPSGGNYWSDYTGADINGDGIGDTPYVINTSNQDNYPMIVPISEEGAVRIVFEEAHLPLFTIGSNPAYEVVGGHSEFADYLDAHGYSVSTIDPGTTIDATVLAPVDVLVISAPQNSYSTSEIDAIETWVEGGGRLLLISEWSNVGAKADAIAARFGITLKLDLIHDSDEYVIDDRWPYYDGSNLLSHPITAGVTRVEIYYSDGIISGPIDEIPLIVTDKDGTATWDNGSPALGVSLMSALNGGTAGSGRLIVITDSDILDSAYDADGDGDLNFYDSDNEVLALNAINWLAAEFTESPVASFTYSPESPVHSGEVIAFNASSSYDPDGSIVSYDWDFGELGATGSGEIVSYSYADDGVYTVTLTVTDDDSETAVTSVDIIVLSGPVHNLDTGVDYSTIQAAIDATETLAGHTIFVDSGIYYETVNVYKSISLIGENSSNTIIDGNGALSVLAIHVDGVSVSGFTVMHSYGEPGDGGGGLVVSGVGNIQIRDIIARNNDADWGVHLTPGSHDVNITNTIIVNNSRGGLLLNENQRVTVSDNLITNNGAGISLHISSNNSISGNAIADNNGVGIYLSESSNNNFLFGNNVTNNEHGVQIENCNGNIFYHNNFISNTVQASVTSGYANIWDDGYPSCGNYWSDYAGVDADSDGIGDTPYIIDASNQDRYPLVSSFQEEYLLNVNVVGSGSVALNNTGPYIYGDVVELTAVPDSGWTFSGWSGDLTGSVNPETIVMNGDKTVTANFIVPNTPPYQPQLSITPSLAVEDNDDLVVTVTGPTPADPDRDSVTYTYRWFVNVGTGGFVDDEVAGRGDHTGNTVPAADTVVGDIWRVEVTPVDEHGTAGASAIAEWQIVVDATKPVAHAGPDRTVNEDTQVTFDGSSSTDNVGIVSYVWAFTDVTPKTLTGKNPIYTFATPGTYTVTLNVTDAAGNWDSDAVIITVSPVTPSDGSGQDGTGQDGTQSSTTPPDVAKPVANAGPDKLVVEDNVVSFDAGGSSDNTGIVSYEWDFGDGTAGTGITVTHTYAKSGNYTVTLTVKDAAGNSQTASISVTVQRDTDGDGVPDVTDTDDDNDGMSDAWEIENELDPIDAQDASLDPDADGLTNLEEYQQGMNPNVSDARPLSTLALAIGGFTAATTAILVSLTGVGKAFDSAISKLPIPDELKQFLQLYGEKLFETVDKAKLEAIEKAAFITRGEVIALGASALIATIVFGSEEANGVLNFLTLSGFVNFLPSVLVSVCVVIIFTELFETCCARTCKVHKQFRLWMYGIIMFLASGIVFHFPVGSPGITRYKSGEISKKAKGLFVLSKMLLLLTLAIPFTALVMMGFNVIGELGLWITLTTVFSSLIPLRPLVGKALFDYRKEVSLTALAVSGVLLFSFVYSRLTYVTFLPYVTYLAAGAVSAVLAAITLTQLRKAHPT